MTIEERRRRAAELAGQGWTHRAIAAELGVSRATIIADLRRERQTEPEGKRLAVRNGWSEFRPYRYGEPRITGSGLMFREIKERRRKMVKLPPELVSALKAHRAAQNRERLAAANVCEDHDLVWCQPNGRATDPRADWQEWSDILQAAGLPHHGVHSMRHSAATIALGEGVALAVVQEMLRHSDIRVTRGYTHVSSPLADDAAARVGKALFGPTATKTATRTP